MLNRSFLSGHFPNMRRSSRSSRHPLASPQRGEGAGAAVPPRRHRGHDDSIMLSLIMPNGPSPVICKWSGRLDSFDFDQCQQHVHPFTYAHNKMKGLDYEIRIYCVRSSDCRFGRIGCISTASVEHLWAIPLRPRLRGPRASIHHAKRLGPQSR